MSKPHLEAVLWDMDGVIADTMQYHYSAWHDILKAMGVPITEADFRPLFGQRHDRIIRHFLGDMTHEKMEALSDRKQLLYRERVAKDIRALPGAIDLMKALQKNGIKSALASSATKENVDIIVQGLGITKLFQAFVNGPEVAEGKPSPLIFQLAAKKLGVSPANCVVIEDAIAGVAAAKAGGMKCIAVTNSLPRKELTAANLIVDSLTEVDLKVLKGLFEQE
jgi:beta-phosphoglucomutase